MASSLRPLSPWVSAAILVATTWASGTALGQSVALTEATDTGLSLVQRAGGLDKTFITESTGTGAAFVDFDVDGWPDVFLVNGLGEAEGSGAPLQPEHGRGGAGEGHRLFRNHGGRFEVVPAAAGLRDVVWGTGTTQGDVDNDGWPDLFVAAIGGDRLYRNNGDGSFSVWEAGVGDPGWSAAASMVDLDADGALDLFVARYVDLEATHAIDLPDRCSYSGVGAFCGPEGLVGQRDLLYRNTGEAQFVPWPLDAVDEEAGFGLAVAALDCDDEAGIEIYVANDSTMNALYRRRGDELVDTGLLSGAGFSSDGREQAGMGITVADADHDDRLDLFVTNFQNDHNTFYRGLGGCQFQDETDLAGLAAGSFPYMGWGALFLDVDGDADQDLFVANGHIHPAVESAGVEPYHQRNQLYLNELRATGRLRFDEVGPEGGLGAEASSRGAARADVDRDGDTDLLVTNIDAAPSLLVNEGQMALPALTIRLLGRASNRSAYGATVWVVSGTLRQRFELRDSDGYAGANESEILAFLPSGLADSVEVRWPSGDTMAWAEIDPGRVLIDERGALVRRDRQ